MFLSREQSMLTDREWLCLDQSRIKKAVCESRSAFDPLDPYTCSIEEFDMHMMLLNFRSDLFGIAKVIEHVERYAYCMNPKHCVSFWKKSPKTLLV